MDPVIQISAACALAALWLFGAVHKIASFGAFRATVRAYRVLPGRLASPSATIVIGLELVLGLALLTSTARVLALGASAGLLMVYAAAIGVNIARGRRHIDCGCMGPGSRQSLSEWLVGRNLMLAALALAAALVPIEARVLVWVDAISVGGTVGILAAFYATANRLIANAGELESRGG